MTTQQRGSRERKQAKSSGSDESAREALDRARGHALQAVSESLAALRALIDAASIAANGSPADAHPALRALTNSIDQLADQLSTGTSMVSPAIVAAVLDALDAEITRWELRSAEDAEARPVLRAFLGVREILWEVGFRRADAPDAERARRPKSRSSGDGSSDAAGPSRGRRQRVQRVDVQG